MLLGEVSHAILGLGPCIQYLKTHGVFFSSPISTEHSNSFYFVILSPMPDLMEAGGLVHHRGNSNQRGRDPLGQQDYTRSTDRLVDHV